MILGDMWGDISVTFLSDQLNTGANGITGTPGDCMVGFAASTLHSLKL